MITSLQPEIFYSERPCAPIFVDFHTR